MSGTEQYLIDTNILIYFFEGKFTDNQKNNITKIFEHSFNISVISKIEFLGFKDYFDNLKYEKAKEFLSNTFIIPLSDELIDKIIFIKQKWNLKLGDAIISATALIHNFTIVTRNHKDFERVENIKILNPFNDF